MSFEDKLKQYISDTPVPEKLLPSNIADMLYKANVQRKTVEAKVPVPVAAADASTFEKQAPFLAPRRNVIFKMIAAAAACLVMAVGVTIHYQEDMPILLFGKKPSTNVAAASNYEAVYQKLQTYSSEGQNNSSSDVMTDPNVDIIPEAPSKQPAQTQPTPPQGASNAASNGGVTTHTSGQLTNKDSGIMSNAPTAETENTAPTISTSNEQVAGVSEADVIKTDGTDIYYIAQNKLYIIAANGGKMTKLSETKRDNITPFEMFISGNRLIVLSNKFAEEAYTPKPPVTDTGSSTPATSGMDTSTTNTTSATTNGTTTGSAPAVTTLEGAGNTTTGSSAASSGAGSSASASAADSSASSPAVADTIIGSSLCYMPRYDVMVEIYDITDKTKPTVVNSYMQNGGYVSSRMVDSILYLVTNYNNYQMPATADDVDRYVPYYTLGTKKCYLSPADISVPSKIENSSYTILAGLDVTAASPLVSTKAVIGYSGQIYASQDNIYITGFSYSNNKTYTTLARFSIKSGKIAQEAAGYVSGQIINQFAMDESNGYFRIATTTYDGTDADTYSSVYVLDLALKEVGKVSKLAPGETIQSVRFEGGKVYVVTFKQTDPLFEIDLSNPKKPVVLSDLKINGYSTYLQQFKEGLLLGFGQDADENGNVLALKLAMFTTGAGGNVTLQNTINLHENFTNAYSPALYSHKAILISGEKNVIGIPTQYFDGISYVNEYFLFSYDEKTGFAKKGVLQYMEGDPKYTFERGLFIDNVLYAVSPGRIVAATLDTMKVISKLPLE